MNQENKTDDLSQKQISNPPLPEQLEYPLYPVSSDIYSNLELVEDIDPENIYTTKSVNSTEEENMVTEKDHLPSMTGDDLDVPGSELDDKDEITGNEDEENNYYSLGGDNHNDLEEDKGE